MEEPVRRKTILVGNVSEAFIWSCGLVPHFQAPEDGQGHQAAAVFEDADDHDGVDAPKQRSKSKQGVQKWCEKKQQRLWF